MSMIVEQTLDLEGCVVHGLACGDPAGLPVLLLHGMKFQAETWRELGTLDVLAKMGLSVLALDLPGFGRSPVSEVPPGEVLRRVCVQQGFHRVVLIGPSMGGRIALEFALAHPERIAGLILVGAVGVEENQERLSQITAPALIVWGEEDQVAPLAHSEILLTGLGQAVWEVFPGAPHPCYLAQPERWHESIGHFFHRLGPRGEN